MERGILSERGETTVYCHPSTWPLPSSLGDENPAARASSVCPTSPPPSTTLDDRNSLARVLEWLNIHSSSSIKYRLDRDDNIFRRCRTPALWQCLRPDFRKQYWHHPNDTAPRFSLRPHYPLHYDFWFSGISFYSVSLAISLPVCFRPGGSLLRIRLTPSWDGPTRGLTSNSRLSPTARGQPFSRGYRWDSCISPTSFLQCHNGHCNAAHS